MVEWYTRPLLHYLLVGGSLAIIMFLIYKGLLRAGVNREAATGYALISPWFLGFLLWNLYPFLASLYFSLTTYNLFQAPQWVGPQNYITMFTQDPTFWPSVKLTLLYGLFSVPLGLIGAVAVALLLNQNVRGVGIWRTIYYLPAVLPAFATALLWRLLFAPTRNGLINAVTQPIWDLFRESAPAWFIEPTLTMTLVPFIIMSLWGVFGANTVILLAGLKNIPRQLYEAASIDGANNWDKFWNITIPQLSPTIFYTLVIGIIGAVQVFDAPLFIGRLPASLGNFLNVYLYTQAFNFLKMGYGSAIAWFTFALILVLTILVFRSSEAWVFYESEVKGEGG
ncbi:MAG TPA: ABC transporter permease [Chloroflexi bacterium]|nr:ABC transporter permease [Chloroflexota bacterium]